MGIVEKNVETTNYLESERGTACELCIVHGGLERGVLWGLLMGLLGAQTMAHWAECMKP